MRKLVYVLVVLIIFIGIRYHFFNRDNAQRALSLKSYIEILPKEKGLILIKDLKSGKVIINTNPSIAKSYFRPGSLVKIITTYALLKERMISVEDKFNCQGYLKDYEGTHRCWRIKGHGFQNIEEALANSCNLFFIKNTKRLGLNRFKNYLGQFGFKIKDKSYFSNEEFTELSIGESSYLLATPQEILEMITKVAVKNEDEEMELVRNALRKTVLIGTAKSLKNFKPEVAGKTGTSTQEGKKSFNNAWFIGYVPADDPKISFVVFVKQGYSFSEAVPVAKKVLEVYFK